MDNEASSESILNSIKKLVMVDTDYDAFDDIIKIHINTVLANLIQMGVGPVEGFHITGEDEVWDDFLQGRLDLEPVKTYVYLKVKMYFDPPQSSAYIEAINKQLNELEVRLYTATGGY